MRRYKLKKWYPSLPKELKVGTEVNYYQASETYSDSYLGIKSIVDLHPEEVENNPDFWEEIAEPDYEVIKVHDGCNEYYKTLEGDFTINLTHKYDAKNLIGKFGVKIVAVKRLSDNKTFCLGDIVVYTDNPGVKWVIDNFHVRKDDVMLARSKNNEMVETLNTISLYDEKEKDYEILSFKRKPSEKFGDNLFKIKDDNGYYTWEWTNSKDTEEDLIKRGFLIHSVRRLSDGEIFTIGDKVRIKKLQYDGSFDITQFYFDCNGDKLLCNGERCGNGHVSITKIEKKRVVLTTDDEVDLFVGDKYYVPQKNTKMGVLEFTVEPIDYDPSVKRFSSMEKAIKYMIRKTVCLSMEDVYEVCNKAWTRGDGNPTSAFDKDLEELVKSKL